MVIFDEKPSAVPGKKKNFHRKKKLSLDGRLDRIIPRVRYAETEMQCQIFAIIRRLEEKDERWGLIYSVPNDAATSQRARLAAYRKGLTKGISDINCDLPSADGTIPFLRIELKSSDGVQSEEQLDYQRKIRKYTAGNYCVIRSLEAFFKLLARHLGLPEREFLEKVEQLKPDNRPKFLKDISAKSALDAFFYP